MNGATTHLTVLLIDDDADVRYAARVHLDLDDRFHVVAEGSNGRDAVELARACQPDIVLLDLEMPWLSGAEAVPLIRKASPRSTIVIWTVAPLSARADSALAMGASVVLDKGVVYDRRLPDGLAEVRRYVDEQQRPQPDVASRP